MAREFPTSLELLRRYVDIRSDIRTPEGRAGYRQIIDDIRDMVERWSLGKPTIHEFDDGSALGPQEPKPSNLTIDIGEGEELGVWYAHADSIHASMYPSIPDAYHLREKGSEGIYTGCASLDMKAGMVAEICALRGLDDILRKVNRRIRVLFVYAEEENSDGIHAARPLIRNADWAISTEISVGSKLGDNGHVLHARPGRAQFAIEIDALETAHLGQALTIPSSSQVDYRLQRTLKSIKKIRFPDKYKEKDGLMPDSHCVTVSGGICEPESFTTPNKAIIKVEALYTNPTLELVAIEGMIRGELRKILKRDFSVTLVKRRTPYIKPWYEKRDNPLVQAGLAEATAVLGKPAILSWGKPVAEEGVFDDEGVSIITFPPDGQGEHTIGECVSHPYLEHRMIPFLQNMAGTTRHLVKEKQ